jgi:CO/xanthine dehydrogenase FAD-binding subunit
MDLFRPGTLEEALELRLERPDAAPLAGGTDLMVELNFGTRRPGAVLDLTRVAEMSEWSLADGVARIGAGVTYTRLLEEFAEPLPGLAAAARTVGSPQIRNRGTVGGNLGTASPAGDALPPLMAAGAEVEVASVSGTRRMSLEDFLVGPKRSSLGPDELVTAVVAPAGRGPQQFSKIGTRNAMVISVAAVSLTLEVERRTVRAAIGSAGPVVLRAREAEAFAAEALGEANLWESRGPIRESAVERFGELAAAAARPIDDVRGTAGYRRHALSVLARRGLVWVWDAYRGDR